MLKHLIIWISFLCLPFNITAQVTTDNERCRALYDQEKFEEAYHCYAEDNNNLFSVYMSAYLAKFLEHQKNFKKHYKLLLSDNFNAPEQYYYAANLHPKNSKKHLSAIEKGLKQFAADTMLLEAKAEYHVQIKDYTAALKILDQLDSLKKNDLDVLIAQGNILVLSEQYLMAAGYFEKALEMAPKNFEVNYKIGMIYYKQAVDLIQQFSGVDKEEARGMVNEGLSLLKKALPFIQYSFSQRPEDTDLKSALLTCYKKLGMESEYNALKEN